MLELLAPVLLPLLGAALIFAVRGRTARFVVLLTATLAHVGATAALALRLPAAAESELVRIIEQDRGISLIRIDAPVFLYQAHLLWTLAYGKLRWFGSEIGRFDIRLAIGGGITDNQTARGLTGSAGLGASFFIGEWFAIRVDVRDQILEQSLLGESRIVNNLTATLGLSVFIPFEN